MLSLPKSTSREIMGLLVGDLKDMIEAGIAIERYKSEGTLHNTHIDEGYVWNLKHEARRHMVRKIPTMFRTYIYLMSKVCSEHSCHLSRGHL
jgi:hypothetical protein